MAAQTFIDCGVGDLISGTTVLVTGLEDEPDGGLRVYVGARYRGIYVVLDAGAETEQEVLRRAWDQGGHVVIPRPPDSCLYKTEPLPDA